ncbi:ABC transporter substrate-binding protein [Ancylobacter sonchi]|uniref:ABC transporter substrate-binding protein n=1 Tax=Ancylobacter sonchi TaxID=1937790 RepID=UPI001BD50918|nr:ABC transporter substrate-binding protein [Ancylobacter sonchi]MBS7535978.1 ABC transporter substrate-binding protein [Ancylobacter sonchi]
MSAFDQFQPSRRSLLAGAAALGGSFAFGTPAVRAANGVKTLRIAGGAADGPNSTLDPALTVGSGANQARITLVYERLVTLDENFSAKPQLAESWSTNDVGDVWTFKLRPNVTFHDGAPFTAADVLFTFNRILDPALGSRAVTVLGAVDPAKIRAVDDHTVEFTLRQPVVEFPLQLTHRLASIVRQGQTTEQLKTTGIGTGPFKVERFVPGEDPGIFVRHPGYWQPGRPGVDRVEVRTIPEEAARIAALSYGQVDIVLELPLVGLQRLEKDANVKIDTTRSSRWFGLAAFSDTPPFDDVRVRQALKLAANREQLLKAVTGGRGVVANDLPVGPWQKFALQTEQRKYDIAAAKKLLADAGHPNGIDVELHTFNGTGLSELAAAYKAQAEPAGIRINIVTSPSADFWTNVWLKKPFVTTSWDATTVDDALTLSFLSDSKWNESHWYSKAYDQLIAQARLTVNEEKRAEILARAQALLRDESGTVIPFFVDTISGSRTNVKGWKRHPKLESQDFSGITIDG